VIDAPQEPVAASGNSLDVPRARSRFAQRIAQLSNRGVDAVLEFDNRVVGPESLANLLTEDYFSGSLEKHQ
jgi:hypothetical protein